MSTQISIISADVGGTFTDVTAVRSDGRVLTAKVLSTPADFSRGVIDGIEAACGPGPLPPHLVVHGTTVATNAVLSRSGLGRAAIVTTRGFRDVLEIGRIKRPNLYDINWDKPVPVVPRELVFEIDERVDSTGEILLQPSLQQIEQLAAVLRGADVNAIAVSLLNAHVNSANEELIASELRRLGCAKFVLTSSGLTREVQEFERTSTASLNAVLLEPVSRYVETLSRKLRERGATKLLLMQSNGGVIPADAAAERPVVLLESGPAAGVLGAAWIARELGLDKVIAFDMGGTTAKACLIEGGMPREAAEFEVGGELNTANPLLRGGGYPVRLPCLELCEVGAGGGSIAWIDEAGALRVGPQSAGADPGPACYGLGGTKPTVADAQIVLGYLTGRALGGGNVAVKPDLARKAIDKNIAKPLGVSVEEAALNILSVANVTMGRAIRAVSVERGRNPTDYTLVAFGGSGPIHAAATARELGIRRVVIPPFAGVFSALAMIFADLRRDAVQSVHWELAKTDPATLKDAFAKLEASLEQEFTAMGIVASAVNFRRTVDVRYRNQSGRIEVPVPETFDVHAMVEAFEAQHEQLFGHRSADDVIDAVALRLTAVAPGTHVELGQQQGSASAAIATQDKQAFFEHSGWQSIDVLDDRTTLAGGRTGPLVVNEANTTVLVPPGCTATLGTGNAIIIDVPPPSDRKDLVLSGLSMEVVRHRFEAIVDDMSSMIPQTARSMLVRDSHDFSTALLTPEGEIVAQGLGVLIHLGTVAFAIKAVLKRFATALNPGDVFILNDPYEGGTHLNDYILVAPVFLRETLLGYCVVTAHHLDIGGGIAGGFAHSAKDIFQEGIVVPPIRLVRGGTLDDDIWRLLTRNTRLPREVVGDLRAQLAACRKGEIELQKLAAEMGPEPLRNAMRVLLDYTEQLTRAALARLPSGTWTATDYVDDDSHGEPIRLTVDLTLDQNQVRTDFSKSSAQVLAGYNCNLGTVASSVFMAFRSVLDSRVPDNAGFMRCFDITSKPGAVVNPIDPGPAASRGLTGFRLGDLMYRVLAEVIPDRVWAASEGGLSVVTVVGRRPDGTTYVLNDTVGGGTGGRPTKDGVEGIAPGIGNVRNNSIEIMERDFPIRMRSYAFMPDTGGAGKFRGANAMVREYEVLAEQATAYCRADRRRFTPWGLTGGGAGSPSRIEVLRKGTTSWELLPISHVFAVQRGDRFRVVTAGSGGYGPPQDRTRELIERDLRQQRVTAWPPGAPDRAKTRTMAEAEPA